MPKNIVTALIMTAQDIGGKIAIFSEYIMQEYCKKIYYIGGTL